MEVRIDKEIVMDDANVNHLMNHSDYPLFVQLLRARTISTIPVATVL